MVTGDSSDVLRLSKAARRFRRAPMMSGAACAGVPLSAIILVPIGWARGLDKWLVLYPRREGKQQKQGLVPNGEQACIHRTNLLHISKFT